MKNSIKNTSIRINRLTSKLNHESKDQSISNIIISRSKISRRKNSNMEVVKVMEVVDIEIVVNVEAVEVVEVVDSSIKVVRKIRKI